MKYIETDKLKSEIQSLIDLGYDKLQGNLYHVISLINSLQQEQQEVDLEKEIEEYWMATDWGTVITLGKFKVIARYFYGLGQLNSK